MNYHLMHSSKFVFASAHTINDQVKLETYLNKVIQKARERDNYVSSSLENDKLIIKVSNDLFTEVEKIDIQRC